MSKIFNWQSTTDEHGEPSNQESLSLTFFPDCPVVYSQGDSNSRQHGHRQQLLRSWTPLKICCARWHTAVGQLISQAPAVYLSMLLKMALGCIILKQQCTPWLIAQQTAQSSRPPRHLHQQTPAVSNEEIAQHSRYLGLCMALCVCCGHIYCPILQGLQTSNFVIVCAEDVQKRESIQ